MTDRRDESDGAAGASGLLQTLRAGGLEVPMLGSTEPRWGKLRFAAPPGPGLRDHFRGALVGGAIGDAMGRSNEGLSASEVRARRLREYQPWQGWRDGPNGTITDDTQMTIWLAESILTAAQRRRGQGGIFECRISDFEFGGPNRPKGPCGLRGFAWRGEGQGADGIGETGNRGSGADPRDRLIDPEDLARRFTLVFARWASKNQRDFPCALWCFLASPEDFEHTLFAAVDAGHDADTVAAMACSVAGAYHGYSHLPQRLLNELECRDHLVGLADNLVGLHRKCYGASSSHAEGARPVWRMGMQ